MKSEYKVLKSIESKGNNRRFSIQLLRDVKTNDNLFVVKTRRLENFKKREIIETSTAYSIESFFVLKDMISLMADDSEIKNKILLKEISKIEPYKAWGNVKI